jgi:AraC-like DNA-binding protein
MKMMKPTIESVESLYNRKEPTGDRILDEVVNCLRKTRIIAAADLAILMDVKKSYLYGAMHILTGMALGDFINRWRLIQARELLRQEVTVEAIDGFEPNATKTDRCRHCATETDRVKRLEKTARRCGWRSYRVLLRVAKRYGFELEQ